MARTRQRAKRGFRAFVDLWTGCFAKHNLLTWASAIAFQVLVALVPLTLLLLGVLGALGERSVWQNQLRPGIERRLPKPTACSCDSSICSRARKSFTALARRSESCWL